MHGAPYVALICRGTMCYTAMLGTTPFGAIIFRGAVHETILFRGTAYCANTFRGHSVWYHYIQWHSMWNPYIRGEQCLEILYTGDTVSGTIIFRGAQCMALI